MNRFQEDFVFNSGKFLVDIHGRVWRGMDRAEKRTGEYLQVRVMSNGIRYCTCAHRLVWRAIRGPIPSGMVINHKNGIKDDNRPENLECVTPGQNMSHALVNRLRDQRGERNPSARLRDKHVVQIRLAYASGSFTQAELAERFGVDFRTISKIVRGERRAAQGGPVGDYAGRRNWEKARDSTGRILGKRAAGALLDGREWREYPNA